MNLVLIKSYIIEKSVFLRHYYLSIIEYDQSSLERERYEYHPGMKLKKTTADYYNENGKSRIERIYYLCDNCMDLLKKECDRKFKMFFRNCDVFAGNGFQSIMLSSIFLLVIFTHFFGRINFLLAAIILIFLIFTNLYENHPEIFKCNHIFNLNFKEKNIKNYLYKKHLIGL